MDGQTILDELLKLLEQSGVKVRTAPLGGGGGGLCMVKGESIFFLDTDAPAAETAALCAEAVSKTADVEKVYIKPEVRQLIEKYGKD